MDNSEMSIAWDLETDIVVVGSGFAGLAAAIEARQAGCSVMVLEKMKGFGGNSTLSDGCIAAADTDFQRKAGIEDSPELMHQDMLSAGLGLNQPELVRVVTQKSNETFEWTRDFLGVEYQERVGWFGGHSLARSHTTLNRTGADIIKQQLKKARQLGVEIKTKCYLQLIHKYPSGRVKGVQIRQGYQYPDTESGKVRSIKVRKAVVLAAGGYGNDIHFRTAQDPRLDASIASTNKHSTTGGALREAIRIGALPVHLSWIQLGPWACPDEKGYGIGPDFSAYIAFPYGIIVDPETGCRLVNEMADRKIRADALLNAGHPCVCLVDQQGIEASGFGIEHCVRKGVVKQFDSLADLAAEYGMPADAFEETVSRYNQFVSDKADRDFGRPISEKVAPIQQAPFYAMRIWPKVHYTMGGILINAKAQVLDLNQQPILGFYAAGEVAGGVHGASRLGSCAIVDCLVFGRIAGQEAAKL
jgi:flavocytochrome c